MDTDHLSHDRQLIPSPASEHLDRLSAFIEQNHPLFVLTGAGCSTDSGIPDYRDINGDWKQAKPVPFQDFIRYHSVRQRYWARSMLGWPRVAKAAPNTAHRVLESMERAKLISTLVTQNVDGLHRKAGHRNVIDLHGNLAGVRCLGCNVHYSRTSIQSAIASCNPVFTHVTADTSPDGDAHLHGIDVSGFEVPACAECGGILKPDVVFFGESVPGPRVERAFHWLEESRGMLVVGSSLAIYSGFRFCRRAADRAIPVAAINLGRTRADAMFKLKVEMNCAKALSGVKLRLFDGTS